MVTRFGICQRAGSQIRLPAPADVRWRGETHHRGAAPRVPRHPGTPPVGGHYLTAAPLRDHDGNRIGGKTSHRPGGKPGKPSSGRGGRAERASGGPGGRPPGKILRAVGAGDRRSPSIERRRVATGANHPASHSSAFRRGPGTPAGAPTGDQSTAMHVTPKPPLVRQDRITNRSVQHQSCSVVQPFPGCFSDSVSWLNDRGGCGPGDVPSGEGLPAGHPAASGGM